MLVLTRRIDEQVIIEFADGRRLVVKVLGLRSDSVRLGFDGPDNVTIHREEIQQRIDAEKPRQQRDKDRENDL